MLLKPWWDLQANLKQPLQTWANAFCDFVSRSSDCVRFILSGIQYFHECESAAKKGREDEEAVEWAHQERRENLGEDFDDFGLEEDVVEEDSGLSEEGLANLIAAQTPLQEMLHA